MKIPKGWRDFGSGEPYEYPAAERAEIVLTAGGKEVNLVPAVKKGLFHVLVKEKKRGKK